MNLLKITTAKYEVDYVIIVTFNNGSQLKCDMSQVVLKGVFKKLQDKSKFQAFNVNDGVLEWAGELDIAPEYLYKIGLPFPGFKKPPEPDYVSWTA